MMNSLVAGPTITLAPFSYGKLTVLIKGGMTVEATDLLALLSDQQPRRLRVIENLLRGKRTVSTLYWGQRYRLLPLLDLDKACQRGSLDAVAQDLVTQKLATFTADEQPQLLLTATGVTAQAAAVSFQPQNWENWGDLDVNSARQRLLLAVQVVSEYAHQTNRYYPLTVDLPTRQAVRQWFYHQRSPQLGQQILTALQTSLEQLPSETAALTTAGLTGYHQPGLTTTQLAGATTWTAWQIYLMHVDAIAQITLAAQAADHPLHTLLAPTKALPVTRSAQATLAAVQGGGTLDQVAQQRHVKASTVKEHLLEAAIMLPLTALPYDQLLPESVRTTLLAALPAKLDDWEYTALPADLQQAYDFFTFRLLAIFQDKRGEQA